MTSIFIIDSNDEIRTALGGALSEASICDNEIQLLNKMEEGGCGIILLHYGVCHQDTSRFIKALKQTNPTAEVVLIVKDQQEEEIINCILAGANGYQNLADLGSYAEKLVRVILTGEAWISRKMVANLIKRWRDIEGQTE